MSLQGIFDKIGAVAQQKADALLAEATTQVERILAEGQQKATAHAAGIAARGAEMQSELQGKMQQMAVRENANDLLRSKQSVLATVLEGVYVALCALPDDQYGKLVKALGNHVQAGPARVRVPKARIDVTKKALPETVELVADDAIGGGFVYEGKGRIMDASFKSLVFSEHKDALLQKAARTLGFL